MFCLDILRHVRGQEGVSSAWTSRCHQPLTFALIGQPHVMLPSDWLSTLLRARIPLTAGQWGGGSRLQADRPS